MGGIAFFILTYLPHAVNLLWSEIKGSCVKNCATLCLLKKRLYLCSPNKYANNNK